MKKLLASVLAGAFPLLAFAQTYQGGGIAGLITFFGGILGILFPVLISLAVIYFIWQVFQYTIAADEEKKKTAKGQIVMGIVGIFIMVSIWGLVGILQSTFNTGSGTSHIVNPVIQ